ncbi:MFS transporter [Citreimonas sp.]|uniref:MFS transporter n=1 Tax=Citreimonas sp. TaxID=3036715 RepID=UPI00405A34F6
MTGLWAISTAGFLATAMTYGPARMGFGLFLGEFRSDFSLSTGMAGLISTLGFSGFLVGLLVAYALLARRGPRWPVTLGLGAATAGFALVALAPNAVVLAAGVLLAMASAGFSWAPFNDAAHRVIADQDRPRALSLVSTGTSVGVAAAGLTALALHMLGLSWRLGWAGFALAGALATLVNAFDLGGEAARPGPRPDRRLAELVHRAAWPIYGVAASYGTVSAIWISFAADRVQQAGGLPGLAPAAAPGVVFLAYGIFGLSGALTGWLHERLGLPRLLYALQATAALSVGLVALAPAMWSAVLLSAGLQGAHVMMTSAALSFWTERLYPDAPSRGFTAALLAVAAGSAFGPAAAGYLSQAAGGGAMFLTTAALPAITLLLLIRATIRERPVAD